MCLHTTSNTYKTSPDDIECWKVFAVVKHLKTGMVWRTTPQQDRLVPDNVINGFIPMEPDDPYALEVRAAEIEKTHNIGPGFIHSYSGKTCAEIKLKTEYKKWLYMMERCNYRYHLEIPGYPPGDDSKVEILGYELYRCVIPANTPYYSGITNPDTMDSTLGYASRKILVREREDIITPEKKEKTWPMPYGGTKIIPGVQQ